MLNLRKIRSIRKFLDHESCNTVVVALVLSHLDYANSLLYGVAKTEINHLQRIQNMSAKLVLNTGRYDSSREALNKLHWLPIKSCIKHKILPFVHKCLFGKVPQYLKGLLTVKQVNYHRLRSNSHDAITLRTPYFKRKTLRHRSFSNSGPVLWNALPVGLRVITNYGTFKSRLKTFLFKQAFDLN